MSKVRLYGDTSGFVDLKAPDVANDVTITLPNTTGPFATETYVDSAIAAIPGIGSNVVSVVSAADTTTTSSTFSATGMSATITPSSATSKVLAFYVFSMTLTANSGSAVAGEQRLVTGATPLVTYLEYHYMTAAPGTGDRTSVTSGKFLHSPGTTSPVTYTVEIRTQTTGSGRTVLARAGGSIVLIEVAV